MLPACHRRGLACLAFVGGSRPTLDPYDVDTTSGPLAKSLLPGSKSGSQIAPAKSRESGDNDDPGTPELLVSIGADDDHIITVYESSSGEWNDYEFVCSAALGIGRPLVVCGCASTANDGADIFIGGEGFLAFGSIDRELKQLRIVPGRFGAELPWQSITSA